VSDFRKLLDDLETRAAEASLISDLATSPESRAEYTRLAGELMTELETLREHPSDEAFLMRAAQTCRSIALAAADPKMQADLLVLAADFENEVKAAD
jgi:hypothetical protein